MRFKHKKENPHYEMWTQKRKSPLYIVIDYVIKSRSDIMTCEHKRENLLYILL